MYHLGHQAEAFERFEKVMELAPNDPNTLLELAQMNGAQGRTKDASSYAERSLAKDPPERFARSA
jgi:tetratricopeptide (TPR) repeat protein